MAPVLDEDDDEKDKFSDALVGVVASEVVVVVALEIALDIVDDGKAVEVVPVDGWLGIQFNPVYDSAMKVQAGKSLHTMILDFQESQTTVQGGCIIGAANKTVLFLESLRVRSAAEVIIGLVDIRSAVCAMFVIKQLGAVCV